MTSSSNFDGDLMRRGSSPFISCLLGLTCVTGLSLTSPTRAADTEKPISFVNEVIPVLTKSGCNMGICHAKAGGGQNGFQL
ncbi:MAG: hypothetical protein KDA85_11815, partial [Planctomycetaceae bacterium]|nr:hypothetical protein [Planctomycetaceae bacterium]